MVNNCKFINIILTLCGLTNTSCRYMSDPHSCPSYDEAPNHPWQSQTHPDWVDRLDEDVKHPTDFIKRIEAELNGMGIKVEKIEEETNETEAPDWF